MLGRFPLFYLCLSRIASPSEGSRMAAPGGFLNGRKVLYLQILHGMHTTRIRKRPVEIKKDRAEALCTLRTMIRGLIVLRSKANNEGSLFLSRYSICPSAPRNSDGIGYVMLHQHLLFSNLDFGLDRVTKYRYKRLRYLSDRACRTGRPVLRRPLLITLTQWTRQSGRASSVQRLAYGKSYI